MATARADRLRNDTHILRVAARLLAHDPAATVQAIADAAGLARLTVYRRYPDRDALITALRAAVDAELEAALSGLPPWDSGAAYELVHSLARVAARYPVALLRYAPVPGGPSPADAHVSALLREGQRSGVLRDDLSADTLNAALFGVLSGVLAAASAPTASDGSDEASDAMAHAAADTVLTLVLPGMSRPGVSRSIIPPQPPAPPIPPQEGRR